MKTSPAFRAIEDEFNGQGRGDAISIRWDETIREMDPAQQREFRAGIDSITGNTGAPFSFKTAGTFMDAVRAQAGALQFASWTPMTLTGQMGVPHLTTDVTGQWFVENPGVDITVSNLATEAINLQVRTFAAGLRVSRQNVYSAAPAFSLLDVLVYIVAAVVAKGIERAAIQGLGSGSNQPLGITNNSNIPTLPMGTNGGPITIAQLALLEKAVADANADRPGAGLAFHTSTDVRRYGRANAGFTGAGPIWTDQNTLIGRQAFASTNCPNSLTKGTSNGNCSALIFGAWMDLLIALFGPGIDVVIDPFSKKYQGMSEIAVFGYCDVAPLNSASFVKSLDVTTP